MKNEVFGKIKNYNPETHEVLIKLAFATSEHDEFFEEALKEKKPVKFSYNYVKKNSKSYEQQKMLWVDITKILIAKELEVNKKNKEEFYGFVKMSIFPAKFYSFYDDEGNLVSEPYPPSSMHELTVEEMTKVIEEVRKRNRYVIRLVNGIPTKVFINWKKQLNENFLSEREPINE